MKKSSKFRSIQKLSWRYGSLPKAADALGVVRETMRLWSRHGIPLSKALRIEFLTNKLITAEELLKEARSTFRPPRSKRRRKHTK